MNRVARAVVVALLVLTGLLSGTVPAASGATTESDTPTITIGSVSPGTLRPDQPLTVSFTVDAKTDGIPEGSTVELRMQRSVLSTRYAVRAWAEASLTRGIGTLLVRQPLPSGLDAGTRTTISLTVPAADVGLDQAPGAFGPRGLAVVLRSPDSTRVAVARSHLVWSPPGVTVAPVALTVVVPMTAGLPQAETGLPSPQSMASLTGQGGRLTTLLAAIGPGVTPALDPSLLVAQSGEDPSVTAWRTRLITRLAGRETLTLPSGDADVVSLAHADAADLLDLAVRRSRAQASALDDAADVRDVVALPVGGQADPATVAALSRAGFSTVLLRETSAVPMEEQVTTPNSVATVSGDDDTELTALIADESLSSLLGERPAERGQVAIQQQMLADSAAIVRERPTQARQLLVLAPAGWDPGGRSRIASLMSAPWVRPSTVTGLAAAPQSPVDRERVRIEDDLADSELSRESIDEVRQGLGDLARDAQVAENPEALVADLQQPAVGLVSAAWRDRADRGAALAVFRRLTERVQEAVRVIEGSTVTQVSQEVRLPVTVGNNLDQRVELRVVARPTTSRLQVTEPEMDVELAGNSRTVAYLPVRGVGSGEAAIEVALQTVDGHAIGPPSTVNVVVRADWENRLTLGLAGVCGVVLVFGITRTLRRGRTRAQAIEDDAGAGS